MITVSTRECLGPMKHQASRAYTEFSSPSKHASHITIGVSTYPAANSQISGHVLGMISIAAVLEFAFYQNFSAHRHIVHPPERKGLITVKIKPHVLVSALETYSFVLTG